MVSMFCLVFGLDFLTYIIKYVEFDFEKLTGSRYVGSSLELSAF